MVRARCAWLEDGISAISFITACCAALKTLGGKGGGEWVDAVLVRVSWCCRSMVIRAEWMRWMDDGVEDGSLMGWRREPMGKRLFR